MTTDTIYALSSGHGRAGVAVVRISGPAAGSVLDRMAAPRPRPRFAAFRRVRHPATGELIDHALALWFAGAQERDRRGHGRAAGARRPRRGAGRARGDRQHRGLPAGGARRVRAPRLRERQARPHRRRGPRRPGRCRDGGAAAPGPAPDRGGARPALRGLAAAADRGHGADGGGHRLLRRGRRGERCGRQGPHRGRGAAGRDRAATWTTGTAAR